MAPLACLLQELGHEVRGSDGPLYPPMSTLLEAAGIVPEVGFDAGHLDPAAGASTPDDVIEQVVQHLIDAGFDAPDGGIHPTDPDYVPAY